MKECGTSRPRSGTQGMVAAVAPMTLNPKPMYSYFMSSLMRAGRSGGGGGQLRGGSG